MNTLDDVIYLSMKNDMSFLIGGTMNLYEHQSTFNPNMPLRGIFYFSRLYQSYIAERKLDLYGGQRLQLPKPQYIVFYNGTKEKPDTVELKLSDCFEQAGNENFCLECTVTMLNINYGHNQELMRQCRKLEEYAIFVQYVREYVQVEKSISEAINKAIDDCVKQGVLANFLVKHRMEVLEMILTTYDKELHEKTLLEEGREEGRLAINRLNNYLLKEKRYLELERATNDTEYQKKLLKEYGIQ